MCSTTYILVHQAGLADTAVSKDDHLQYVSYVRSSFSLCAVLPSITPSFLTTWLVWDPAGFVCSLRQMCLLISGLGSLGSLRISVGAGYAARVGLSPLFRVRDLRCFRLQVLLS